MRSSQMPATPSPGLFQSPMAMAHCSSAPAQTSRTTFFPRVTEVCGAWITTTHKLGQSSTTNGGFTKATAKARVSQSWRKHPPSERSTSHPGAKANAAASPLLPAEHDPSTCDHPVSPKRTRLEGLLMLSDSSMEATTCAPAAVAKATKRSPTFSWQERLAPLAPKLHSQWVFQKNVVKSTSLASPTAGAPSLGCSGVVADGAAVVVVGVGVVAGLVTPGLPRSHWQTRLGWSVSSQSTDSLMEHHASNGSHAPAQA
mmetsp:Transcript_69241/g.200591  ORF Transcript_69241/g.200591 Transcript_69241/m.200591 type:complete len:257 (-) Transcript_69241:234-1004(-)